MSNNDEWTTVTRKSRPQKPKTESGSYNTNTNGYSTTYSNPDADTTPVVLRKTLKTKDDFVKRGFYTTEKKAESTNKQHVQTSSTTARRLDSTDAPPKILYSGKELGKEIEHARLNLTPPLKQDQLAVKANLTLKTVQDYERGTAVYNQADIAKLRLVFGRETKFTRPQLKKEVEV
jgi:DNA-binding transcriptional regulator YiaG